LTYSTMLHARLDPRQGPVLWLLIACLACGMASAQISPAYASRGSDIERAESLAQSGQHVDAARLFESAAKRLFFGWDDRVALLSAREYLAAGLLDDADRLLTHVGPRLRGDDGALAARVRAELALERKNPQAALAALSAFPKPWPAAQAPGLLELQARAAFAAGRPLDGVRAYVERAGLQSSAAEREATWRALMDALRTHVSASTVIPADATESERGWFELVPLLDGSLTATQLATRSAEWSARHPGHAGSTLLPAGAASVAGGAAPASTTAPRTPPPLPAGHLNVAVLLPLSGKHELSGVAVRDGFLAAWFADPANLRPHVRIYDTAKTAAAVYSRAIADGAQFVVGPLTKEDLAAIVAAQQMSVPTLALNSLGGGQAPSFLYQFALDPEQEARAAARRIALDGYTRGVALFPSNAWGRRLSEAFTSELAGTNVVLTATQLYDTYARDFSGPLRAVLGPYGGAGDRDEDNKLVSIKRDPVAEAASGPQFAFIAATAATARAIKPQLRFQMVYDLPVYSTSDAWDPSTRGATDMDGLVYPEMPWLLYGGQDAPALWSTLQEQWKTTSRGRWRLYAFGHDAYRLMSALSTNTRYAAISGLTGALEVKADGTVLRELDWARVSGGRALPAGAGGALPAPLPAPTSEP